MDELPYNLTLTRVQVLLLDEMLNKTNPNRQYARPYADLCDQIDELKSLPSFSLPAK